MNEPSPSPLAKRWAHVDINSYFATLLQQENPALRGRPVGVVKDAGRTCIIAASKEAKLKGVATGCLLREAQQLAQDLVVVPAVFDVYLSATRRLKKVFEELAPSVEIFSLDEAFIDLSDCKLLYPDAQTFGQLVQRRIKEELGEWVTCNVGVSYNRLLAKMTSEVSPKGSITEVTLENRDALLATTPFRSVCGVGMRLEAKLKLLGVTVPYQLNFVTDQDLENVVGPFWAAQLRLVGQGEEAHFFTHVRDNPHMKSVGRSLTCFKVWKDEESIKHVLYNLIEEAVYKLRRQGLVAHRVSVGLRGAKDGLGKRQYWYAQQRSAGPVRQSAEVFQIIYHQLYRSWKRTFSVVKCSICLSDLEPWGTTQPVFWPAWHKQEQVATALDKITERYGLFTVKSGAMMSAPVFRPEVTGFLGDKEYQLSWR